MAVPSQLHYGSRFGSEISQLARSSKSAASALRQEQVGSARYTRWFHGEDASPEPMATSRGKFRKVTSSMAAAEIAAATKENLAILGEDATALLLPRLPKGHRLRKSLRSSVLPGMPHLGSCKFGEVIISREADVVAVTQVFIANFEGEIDTAATSRMFQPRTPDFAQMFFGLHLFLDRQGNFLGIDRNRGVDGVAFKTKNISSALCSIASASTGLSIEDLMARLANEKK